MNLKFVQCLPDNVTNFRFGSLGLLGLLPAPLHRAMVRAAHGLRRRFWRIRRPRVHGVRVLALDGSGGVLLIRHSYGSDKWMPPGGGLKRGEEPVRAGQRELLEETGCALAEGRLVAVSDEDLQGASNLVHVVVGLVEGTPRPDRREIVAARFFPGDALPDHMPAGLAEAMRDWIGRYHAGLDPP